ncbi:ABC transporter permease [Lactobacillus sp. ESL0684]|uniref:FtsX-like permease family protein n=1 Tax=Lactobacillus sp. ESL0684 TaxID=2983213 RepID=UPI0023F7FBFC|nr:FtsX-like permease family protein [Lactobacillus sp. ESL0684]WEV43035.1 ABC transporter permease [Lactobacillus sp. ESL0684]
MNKIIWQDIWQSIKHTKGQFLSIFGLMLIGAFALVGLMVTGPDMRDTGNHYAQKLNTPDLSVMSNYGLDKQDAKKIRQTKGLKDVEFGYMTDTVVKNSTKSFRIFSKPKKIGKYELRKGRLPKHNNEIALAAQFSKKYHLGQTIVFTEKKSALGTTLLKRHQFKIVGFIYSGQILSNVNLGQSTNGTGELNGYGIVNPQNFDHTVYTVANLTYKNLHGLDSYSKNYSEKLRRHKKALTKTLKSNAGARKQRIIATAKKQLQPSEQKLSQTKQKLNSAKKQLIDNQNELTTQKEQLTAQARQNPNPSPEEQLSAKQAQAKITVAEKQLQAKQAEFTAKSKTAVQKITAGQTKIAKAKKQLKQLKKPSYSVNNRREIPGGDGNLVHTTVAQVVDDLAKVFPIFLYFVAALVTFTTMNRFIDEERINSGTLKALGYDDHTIISKFVFYGFSAGTLGTLVGIFLGHTLMPQIVYHAYYQSITLPPIETHFYWPISLIALILAWISSVLPAYLTAKNEFREQPAALLLPKPPAAGSKILLEKIPFIWHRLNFTHKVTARNIFRYKKRMLMTIFGVCGAATLLFAGFAVKNSISNMNERQFSQLLHYDLIVAHSSSNTKAIKAKLQQKAIKSETPVYYESMNKTTGKNGDNQSITLIVPQKQQSFSKYVTLNQRSTNQKIKLSNRGVIISERLADLLGAKKGSQITLNSATGHQQKMTVAGITEMYTGHFVFMNQRQYQQVFNHKYHPNANLVILKNSDQANTRKEAAQFMKLSGISGVVQNTAISQELDVVVQSLNLIMIVLIVVAGLLAVVILYNLTNINIAERIRELSTIKVLGFYEKEVTLYIYRETILLTGIGILVGYLTGDLLYRYILYVVPPDNVMFNPALTASSFLWPLGVIGIVTIVLGYVVNRKLSNLDMLEALKSVD